MNLIERIEKQFRPNNLNPELINLWERGKISVGDFFRQATAGRGRGTTHCSGKRPEAMKGGQRPFF